jgi:hypothetical protein
MRRMVRGIVMLLALGVTVPAMGQMPQWKIDFSELAAKAEESVEITLDGQLLRLAAGFLSGSGEEKEIREIVGGLKGIYVRSFTFSKDGQYDRRIAERVRQQIGSGWEPMVRVRSRGAEDVDILVRPGATSIDGLIIIATEPREFTVVNIVGSIDLEKLSRLQGHFGIPAMEIDRSEVVKGSGR